MSKICLTQTVSSLLALCLELGLNTISGNMVLNFHLI